MNQANDAKTASVGSWVKIQEHGTDEEEIFHLAHVTSALENKLSADNAMGQALIGARPGDTVTFEGPAGPINFSVIDVGRTEDA
jgi:transcription elongation GreA/GreB family factor